ncbi:MAG: bifunctional DNA-formamidopyrimidine glycosylase/DNA-(apurinic or apyrimidinic site) lyase [Pseudomonadota bacterium]|uniref:bifunctional DNA-formamidopyrimidine glycosylase/DNA-(apurinic or apyrimidinic site) lyase n=1 Tax=Gallaecimonas pentaromativorans TaxID=584787 RepID=UPI00067E7F7D|nr:bifunctional DNA-formamidopyrimidine glycosylase/DNA-(apurinic or apyrimidinic site) lyase [Gallaecimonas pentaromativorans]MED5526131.1 bifunctional DNA-formamidopyrimidine glycosylase/DNA-(apurinic or apyrimidinic site) lyase [Pseudomonadota bacterium]
MPELPEVETTRRGVSPFLLGQQIARIEVRQRGLRWPVPEALALLEGQVIEKVSRRAKYLVIETAMGSALVHLGMSGALRILTEVQAPGKHDHVDLVLAGGQVMRYTDPRRFGAWLYVPPGEQHQLLGKLGPEPLTEAFDGQRLFELSRKRQIPVKTFIMDNAVVVGVGNIYANEALFMAGIDPRRPAGNVSQERYLKLAEAIKAVLARAIEQGGTTLKDFTAADGKPGYFAQELKVYGRKGLPCPACGAELREVRIGGRSTVYCALCQR